MAQRLCTNGIAVIVNPSDPTTDPNINDVLALLHYDGNFNDVKGNTVTPFNSPSINTLNPKFGSGAGSFNGANCIQILSSSFVFSSDFTLETWIYRNNSNDGVIFNLATSNTSGRVQFGVSSNNLFVEEYLFGIVLTTTSTVPVGQWTHIAFSRSSNTIKAFINGVEGASVSRNSTFGSGEGITIAAFDTSGSFLNCLLDDTRITANVGVYSSDFTPRTTPFPDS